MEKPSIPTMEQSFNLSKNYQHIFRKIYEEAIQQKFTQEGIAVIKGPAKVGKTELANEYFFDDNSVKKYEHRLWLRAYSEEALLASLINLIHDPKFRDLLQVNTEESKNLNVILKKVKHQLEHSTASWLIVLDNVAIPELDTLLPTVYKSHDKPHNLMMTVDNENYHLLSERAPNPIEVAPFTDEEIKQLFAKRTPLLIDADTQAIASITDHLNHQLDALVLASLIYTDSDKREALKIINQTKTLDHSSILCALTLLHTSNDAAFTPNVELLSFFDTYFIPVTWLKTLTPDNLQRLKHLKSEVEVKEGKDHDKAIALTSSWQPGVFAKLVKAADFTHFNDLYLEALRLLNEHFDWTRTHYDKQFQNPVQDAYYSQLAIAVLDKFEAYQAQVKEYNQHRYPATTVLAAAQLANSLGRYYFKLERFPKAYEYYTKAKTIFDSMLSQGQADELKDETKQANVFAALLDTQQLGFEGCLLYVQEILHNIGATTVKISYKSLVEKHTRLTAAIDALKLAYAWQSYLIDHLDESKIAHVVNRLGLNASQAWDQDAVIKQLKHFAHFTQRILAQAYIQQKDPASLNEAHTFYETLIDNEAYMDRPETKPLAYRDLAAVERRMGNYPQALETINKALKSFDTSKSEFPAQHWPGEREQVLYERAKIYLAQKKMTAAQADFHKILEINSASSIYKAKTYYQLAQIAKKAEKLADCKIYLEKAIAAAKDRNPFKEAVYEEMKENHLSLLKANPLKLALFAETFIQTFLLTLKQKKIKLTYDPTGSKIQLGLRIVEGIFHIVPKQAGVTVPNAPGATAQIDLPAVFRTIGQGIADYRKNNHLMQLDNINAVVEELVGSMEALANQLINQYGLQISQLTDKSIQLVIDEAVEAILKFVLKCELLTIKEGSKVSVVEQCLQAILEEVDKTALTTIQPDVIKHWNVRNLFNGPGYLVPNQDKPIYIRKDKAQDKHHRYGYSALNNAPLPSKFFVAYQSESEVEPEDKATHKPKCLVM